MDFINEMDKDKEGKKRERFDKRLKIFIIPLKPKKFPLRLCASAFNLKVFKMHLNGRKQSGHAHGHVHEKWTRECSQKIRCISLDFAKSDGYAFCSR